MFGWLTKRGGKLHRAARRDRVDLVSALLASGADVNARDDEGNTPLQVAAIRDHVHIVKVLLDAGADMRSRNDLGRDALDLALNNRRGMVFAVLLDFYSRADPASGLIAADDQVRVEAALVSMFRLGRAGE